MQGVGGGKPVVGGNQVRDEDVEARLACVVGRGDEAREGEIMRVRQESDQLLVFSIQPVAGSSRWGASFSACRPCQSVRGSAPSTGLV
jgi:hypothetical protein